MDNEKLEQAKEAADSYTAFKARLEACRDCQASFGFEPRPIVWGHPHARVVVISQAPGLKVHEYGRPFSDLSGKKLRQKWLCVSEEQFYNPDLFYFSPAGHCYPGKDKKGHDKKPPRKCWDKWTAKEIEYMKDARLFIVIGLEAASRLFPGRKLEDLVFSRLNYQGKDCFVLPHPSPLNQNWPKKYPEFESRVLPALQKELYQVLDLPFSQLERYRAGEVPPRESWQKPLRTKASPDLESSQLENNSKPKIEKKEKRGRS